MAARGRTRGCEFLASEISGGLYHQKINVHLADSSMGTRGEGEGCRRGAAGVKACMSNVGRASEYWRSHPAGLFTVQKSGPHPQAVGGLESNRCLL